MTASPRRSFSFIKKIYWHVFNTAAYNYLKMGLMAFNYFCSIINESLSEPTWQTGSSIVTHENKKS